MSDLTQFLLDHPDIDMFEVMLPDFNGRLRGKWVPRANIEKVFQGGLKMPLSTVAFDIWGNDHESWVYENGGADGVCVADTSTLAPVPWLKRPTAQVLLALHNPDGSPVATSGLGPCRSRSPVPSPSSPSRGGPRWRSSSKATKIGRAHV